MSFDHENGHEMPHCSFCGKPQDDVNRLVLGPGVFICEQCIELCCAVLDGDAPNSREMTRSSADRKSTRLNSSH